MQLWEVPGKHPLNGFIVSCSSLFSKILEYTFNSQTVISDLPVSSFCCTLGVPNERGNMFIHFDTLFHTKHLFGTHREGVQKMCVKIKKFLFGFSSVKPELLSYITRISKMIIIFNSAPIKCEKALEDG